MNLVKEKQGGLVPTGLKRWPIKLIKHFADATGVSPSPAGPAGCCPLNFLNLINLKFQVRAPNGVYISQLIRFARASSYVADFNTRNKLLTQKLLKQGYRYHKLRKTFSKFYRRYYDLISKFQVGLKSLLRQGLSEPDFYGDLVYKLKKIVGSNNFSAQFIKIISHYKKIGYNINVLQQTACLVVNPITVGNFAFLFNCTPVGRTSDSMMVPT